MIHRGLYRPWRGGWGDLEHLHREMDEVFRGLSGASPRAASWGGAFPAVNFYETEDAYVLTAELPGVGPEDIRVSLEGSTIALQGERRIEHGGEDVSVHRAERQGGRFHRAFELPAPIDAEKVEAVHRNGVLMLRLPKTPEARRRRISVQPG